MRYASWVIVAGLLVAMAGAVGGRAESWPPAEDAPTASELAEAQHRIDRHLLRVQRERFEARARGESDERLERLDREFRRTQQRRVDALRAGEAAAAD